MFGFICENRVYAQFPKYLGNSYLHIVHHKTICFPPEHSKLLICYHDLVFTLPNDHNIMISTDPNKQERLNQGVIKLQGKSCALKSSEI